MYSILLLAATLIIVLVSIALVVTELFPGRFGFFVPSSIRPGALLAFVTAVASGFYHLLNDHEPGTTRALSTGEFALEHSTLIVISLVAFLIFVRQSVIR